VPMKRHRSVFLFPVGARVSALWSKVSEGSGCVTEGRESFNIPSTADEDEPW
jgi:hypothetical protein